MLLTEGLPGAGWCVQADSGYLPVGVGWDHMGTLNSSLQCLTILTETRTKKPVLYVCTPEGSELVSKLGILENL